MKELVFFIPYNLNFILIENKFTNYKRIYFYNDNFYFFTNQFNNKIFIDKNTNIIKIKCINNDFNKSYSTEINNFLISWDSFFFKKIKFVGKGFKFKKKINNLFLFFNRAHKCFFIGNNIILRRLSKNKVILLKNNYKHLIYDCLIIKKIRWLNIYTKRGLRTVRQIVFKKRGKTAIR